MSASISDTDKNWFRVLYSHAAVGGQDNISILKDLAETAPTECSELKTVARLVQEGAKTGFTNLVNLQQEIERVRPILNISPIHKKEIPKSPSSKSQPAPENL